MKSNFEDRKRTQHTRTRLDLDKYLFGVYGILVKSRVEPESSNQKTQLRRLLRQRDDQYSNVNDDVKSIL